MFVSERDVINEVSGRQTNTERISRILHTCNHCIPVFTDVGIESESPIFPGDLRFVIPFHNKEGRVFCRF